MINKFIRKIRQFEYRIATSHDLQGDHLALTQLLKMFPDQVFLPLTAWSISPREVLHICNDIVINKRKSIVEFGSGFSTICIAQLLKINNINSNFISIENNADWANELTQILRKFNLENYVTIIVAPITEVPREFAKDEQLKWYDVPTLQPIIQDLTDIDVVIVDGPFGGTTKYARYSAIPFLKHKLADDYAIFLDDTTREHESVIAKDWKNLLNGHSKNHGRYMVLTSQPSFDVSSYGLRYKL